MSTKTFQAARYTAAPFRPDHQMARPGLGRLGVHDADIAWLRQYGRVLVHEDEDEDDQFYRARDQPDGGMTSDERAAAEGALRGLDDLASGAALDIMVGPAGVLNPRTQI